MMISSEHLVIGISERTSAAAAAQLAEIVFEKGLVSKVSMVKIPKKRDYMHIDTIFTQVKRDVWVMMGLFSEQMNNQKNINTIEKSLIEKREDNVVVMQFMKNNPSNPIVFVKSWNEWAEGNVLEPSVSFGCGFLEAHKRVVAKFSR